LTADPTEDFSDLLGQELERTDDNHLPLLSEEAGGDFQKAVVEDLSPDTEMAELSKNQMFYQALLEVVNRRDRLTRTALEGR
jgi:flagellar basal body rod protein FlgB